MEIAADRWGADVVTGGLQKCLGGPSGSSPITLSDTAAAHIFDPPPCRDRASAPTSCRDGDGPRIGSNYFDLAMVMDYWSEKRLNHHTEATSMLYAARECARIALRRRAAGALRPPCRGRARRGRRAARAWG